MAVLELVQQLEGIFGESGSFVLQVDGMEIHRERGRFIVTDVATGKQKPFVELDFKEQATLEAFLATLDHLSPLPIHSAPPPDPEDLFSEAAGERGEDEVAEAYKELSS